MKVLRPNSIILGTRKLWWIFPIKQKFDTTAAFLDNPKWIKWNYIIRWSHKQFWFGLPFPSTFWTGILERFHWHLHCLKEIHFDIIKSRLQKNYVRIHEVLCWNSSGIMLEFLKNSNQIYRWLFLQYLGIKEFQI